MLSSFHGLRPVRWLCNAQALLVFMQWKAWVDNGLSEQPTPVACRNYAVLSDHWGMVAFALDENPRESKVHVQACHTTGQGQLVKCHVK